MYIGITGLIGSGKSTAADILASMGARVVDADQIGREVVEKQPRLLKKLAREFGSEIIDSHGRLRRKKLAALAFKNTKTKKRLDAIVHPYLLRELKQRMREASHHSSVVVVDAALLLDWNLDREMDYVLVVHAGQELRFRRLVMRGFTRDDALRRQRAQLPFSEYRRRADRVIMNSKPQGHLREKLLQLHRRFNTKGTR